MKKYLLVALITIINLSLQESFAQPILTAKGVSPVVGDNFKVRYATTTSLNQPKTGGANVVWDYSKIIDSSYLQNANYIAPKGMPLSDSFPTATIAAYDGSNSLVAYFNANSTTLGELGEYFFGISTRVSFSPQRTLFFFPSTYKNSYTDSFLYIDPNMTPGFVVKGYDSLSVDGYGSLILPTATYNNVLRQKDIITLKYFYLGIPMPSLTISQTNYEFGLDGIHGPLLELTSNSQQPGVWGADYYTGLPLPIKITNFSVAFQSQMPLLKWKAVNTSTTKGFNIQRSTDGQNYNTIGWVANNNQGSSYTFTDNYSPLTTVSYRLQELDYDGTVTYSNIVSLITSPSGYSFGAYPVPSKNEVHLSVPEGKYEVAIYNIAGKVVYQNKSYEAADKISLASWSKGTYIVQVKTSAGIKTSRLEKE